MKENVRMWHLTCMHALVHCTRLLEMTGFSGIGMENMQLNREQNNTKAEWRQIGFALCNCIFFYACVLLLFHRITKHLWA